VARAVLVTGASRGIGRAIAQAFAGLGDRVAVHHRGSPELADQVLAGLPGGGHVVVQADLADADAVRRMTDQAHVALGGLDVLVNNAGIYELHPITEVSYEQWQDAWRRALAVNLTGAANVTWCAVQYMKETGGRIVNVSSRGAYRGEPRHPAYGASKAGLNSFGQSMARALAPYGIAVAQRRARVRRNRHGAGRPQVAARGRTAGAEPVQPGRHAGGDRRRRGLPGLPRGRVGQRGRPRPERSVLPALGELGDA
jgi:3-oxoacyl-[acyl-carrier protein] reductase